MSYPPVPPEFLARERAQERRSSLLVLLGVILGIFVGGLTCALLVRLLGPLWYGPKYNELAGLLSFFSLIVGGVTGAVLGAVTINRSPLLFLVTFLPLAVLFAGSFTVIRTLKLIDRPRQYVLQIEGTPGASFAGLVLTQGKALQFQGTIPARFTYDGLQLRCAFGLLEPKNNAELGVEVYADGHKVPLGSLVNTGVRVEVYSRGYAENIARTSGGWSRLTRLDVKKMLRDREIPARCSSPEPGDF